MGPICRIYGHLKRHSGESYAGLLCCKITEDRQPLLQAAWLADATSRLFISLSGGGSVGPLQEANYTLVSGSVNDAGNK